jgi:hypothetical protein
MCRPVLAPDETGQAQVRISFLNKELLCNLRFFGRNERSLRMTFSKKRNSLAGGSVFLCCDGFARAADHLLKGVWFILSGEPGVTVRE